MPGNASAGSLTVVGTGIRFYGQLTLEGRAAIEHADKVLFLVADPATFYWVRKLSLSADPESLHGYYSTTTDRLTSYNNMAEHIVSYVRQGHRVCGVTYGHPGVFAYPFHEAIRRARAEGFSARMLPGISAEDSLFADLGIDPGTHGCQSFEATDFLVYKRKFDTSSVLILWQIAIIGVLGYRTPWRAEDSAPGLGVLTDVLLQHYPATHEVVIYEAAQFPVCDPVIRRLPLAHLPQGPVSPLSTLYVPPAAPESSDPEMLARLGLVLPDLRNKAGSV
ncbi:MAG: SAM-dependent methyltransferase [Anaerolineae bacterium]